MHPTREKMRTASLSSGSDALSDLSIEIDELLADSVEYEDDERKEVHAESLAKPLAPPPMPRKSVHRQLRERQSRAKTLPRRKNANLWVHTGRAVGVDNLSIAKSRAMATSAHDSMSPEPRYDDARLTKQSHEDLHWGQTVPKITPYAPSRAVRLSSSMLLYADSEISPLSLSHQRGSSEGERPHGKRPSREERSAYLRATRDSATFSATSSSGTVYSSIFSELDQPEAHLYPSFAKPHEANTLASPPRHSLLGGDRSLGSFFDHEPGFTPSQGSAPTSAHSPGEDLWRHWDGESHALTSRILSTSAPRGELCSGEGYAHVEPLREIENLWFENSPREGVSYWQERGASHNTSRGKQKALHRQSNLFAQENSSESSSQTRGPFIISTEEEEAAADAGLYTLRHMEDNHMLAENSAADREGALRHQEAEEAEAKKIVQDAVEAWSRPMEIDTQWRVSQGRRKPRGFFGLKNTDDERQAHFEVAWDRLHGVELEPAAEDLEPVEQPVKRKDSIRRRFFGGR